MMNYYNTEELPKTWDQAWHLSYAFLKELYGYDYGYSTYKQSIIEDFILGNNLIDKSWEEIQILWKLHND